MQDALDFHPQARAGMLPPLQEESFGVGGEASLRAMHATTGGVQQHQQQQQVHSANKGQAAQAGEHAHSAQLLLALEHQGQGHAENMHEPEEQQREQQQAQQQAAPGPPLLMRSDTLLQKEEEQRQEQEWQAEAERQKQVGPWHACIWLKDHLSPQCGRARVLLLRKGYTHLPNGNLPCLCLHLDVHAWKPCVHTCV